MNLLREYIRELLTEGAKNLDDLEAEDLYIYINRWDGGFMIELGDEESPAVTGEISVDKPSRSRDTHSRPGDPGPCGGAMMVSHSSATQGWGPLLYDLAMELATETAGGLIADRGSVSEEARAVWDYYLANRGDTTGIQLDDLNNTLTPEDEDNCSQQVAISDEQGNRMSKDWKDNPLSKRWTKQPTTLNALRAGKRLVEE